MLKTKYTPVTGCRVFNTMSTRFVHISYTPSFLPVSACFVTNLRKTGNPHKLNIDLGIYNNIERSERICTLCE